MKRLITVFLVLIQLPVLAQVSWNVDSLFNWQDPNLLPSNAHFNTYNEIWGYAVDGEEYAIIGSTAGTHIIDVTVPSLSEEVVFIEGEVMGTSIVHRDYHDFGDYLYIVCDEGASTLQIADLSFLPDSAPVVYNSSALFPRSHNIFIDSSSARMYMCGGTMEFAVYSLVNPEAPTLLLDCPADVSFWSSIGYVHDVFVRGDTAYLNAGANGLFIVDFKNINSPQMLGSLDFYTQQGYNHSGWLMQDQPYYALADETHGMDLKILDVSDMGDIEVLDTIGSDKHQFSIPHNLIYKDDYLFVSYYFDGLFIYDCSDPEHPVLAGFYDTSTQQHQNNVYRGCWGVYPFLPSGRILASDMQTGLWVFGSEQLLGTEEMEAQESTLRVYPNPASNRIVIGGFESNADYRILDITGKEVLNGKTTIFGINVQGLNSGIYSLIVSTDDTTGATRFVKL